MRLLRLLRRVRCAVGLHRMTLLYAPTGTARPPFYRPEWVCVYCARRRP